MSLTNVCHTNSSVSLHSIRIPNIGLRLPSVCRICFIAFFSSLVGMERAAKAVNPFSWGQLHHKHTYSPVHCSHDVEWTVTEVDILTENLL